MKRFMVSAALLASSCVPLHGLRSNGAVGRVLNAQTQQPVVGASVQEGDERMTTQTVSDGSFAIPPRRGWYLVFLLPFPGVEWPPDLLYPDLHVRHSAYEVLTIDLKRLYDSSNVVAVGTVELRPK
jgi:hypothetical protein